tara:strand:+ start:236 stop:697 length:462 start_codon:yes stop_codon:yes gene_type:complete
MILKLGLGWYLYNLLEYCFHKVGHYPHRYNYIYRLHKDHHINYPANDLHSQIYRGRFEGVIAFSLPIMIVAILLYSFLDQESFKIISIELIGLTVISDTLHTQIHTTNSVLERFEWFRKNKRLHYIHHKKLNKNFSFAGLSHQPDKLLGTFTD